MSLLSLFKQSRQALSLTLCLGLLAGCASGELLPRNRKPEAIAPGWSKLQLAGSPFTIVSYVPQRSPVRQGLLTVYIEGDGLAYLTPTKASSDPTPDKPIALQLAVGHPGGGAAYLARPCQYVMSAACAPAYWTLKRFAPEVISSMDTALDQLKQKTNAERLILVGYSGGANIAALLAGRRSDVEGLITVSGNLDHATWTKTERLTPLAGSLNAADEVDRISQVHHQAHYVGLDDDIVPPLSTKSFVSRLAPPMNQSLIQVKGYDHSCCWVDTWPSTLAKLTSFSDINGWLAR